MEAGKGRMRGDSKREATSEEVRQLREENERLKQLVADQALDLAILKEASSGNCDAAPAMLFPHRSREERSKLWIPGARRRNRDGRRKAAPA